MPGRTPDRSRGTGTVERVEVRPPSLYKVLLHNDHYTTMEFVVEVLEQVFGKSESEAIQIMLSVHRTGIGVCGVYSYEIAETKVSTVRRMAEDEGFPLMCSLEPA